MTLTEKEQQLIEDYLLIEDPQERFSAIVNRSTTNPPLAEDEKIPKNRVEGCVSSVWIVGELDNGICQFRTDADSTIIRGITSLISEFYSESSPEEILNFTAVFQERLHLTKQLSPTRRKGVERIMRRVYAIAEELSCENSHE